MSRIVEKNILWFKIPVDNVEAVQTFQGAKEFSRIEPCSIDIEALLALQVMKKLSTVDEGQHKVELFGGLERELEGNNERIIDLGQD